ncbi:microtubule-associated protein 6 isoform 6-T6 [Rhinophrynus dorsalis]
MAWPCVTRACCIARFGNQQDKGDIAVPLMYSKYSEVTDGSQLSQQQHSHQQQQQPQPRPGSAAIESQPSLVDPYHGGLGKLRREGSVMRQDYKPWKSTPEPSCKPRSEYQPSDAPLERETQYKKDFRSWPIPRQGDHPWIPKPSPGPKIPNPPSEDKMKKKDVMGSILPPAEKRATDVEHVESAEKTVTKGKASISFNVTPEILVAVVEERAQTQKREFLGKPPTKDTPKTRETVSTLQSQNKGEGRAGTSYRNEFRAYMDVKPVKPIKAKSQYKPPEDKITHETSYNATFKGECNQPTAADNKLIERRRIRSLYSEPYKESPKVEKPSVQTSKPKKTSTSHKPVKKAKDKQIVPGRASKKKSAETSSTPKPEDKEKSKEMNNKLAEAKE